MVQSKKILWIDDEIEFLKAHLILLEQRGYQVSTASNGEDGIELVRSNHYDLIFLDENMVGMSGLDVIPVLKDAIPDTPIVMVTKNEAESVMEEAIGKKIDDYLTKPVNPAQILLACKKFLESDRIETEKFNHDYMRAFAHISTQMMTARDFGEWLDIYKSLVKWSMELDGITDSGLRDTLQNQIREANAEFSKFIEKNFRDWVNAPKGSEGVPLLSPHIIDEYLQPELKERPGPVFFIVVDCMRYDQWLIFEQMLRAYYSISTDFYCSILPTATPYARNSLFAGLYPVDISRHYPQYWQFEGKTEEHSLNKHEKELMEAWLNRRRIKLGKEFTYIKIFDSEFGKKVEREISRYMQNDLTAIVINAVDMMAHSRSDLPILKEIAPDESAYRELSRSWFKFSSLFGILKTIAQNKDARIVLTTDHGAIRCMNGVKVLGDRETTTSLRYKFGKNIKADQKHAMYVPNPEDLKLPKDSVASTTLIAKEDFYLVYPTDYHHYLNKYKDSFTHGGISMEEMIVPVCTLKPL